MTGLAAREAALRILASVPRQPTLRMPLDDALGAVLAEPLVSPLDLPAWTNSAMDGYVARSADVRGASAARPDRLRVVEVILVGHPFAFAVAWDSVVHGAAVGPPVAFDPTLGSIGDYAPGSAALLEAFQGVSGVMTDASSGAPLDGTVVATTTASSTIAVPHPWQQVYTDPAAGDFHRVLPPGTYTIECRAPGFVDTVVTGVVVTADAPTPVNCAMGRTALRFESRAVPADACSGTRRRRRQRRPRPRRGGHPLAGWDSSSGCGKESEIAAGTTF